jgi:hypothetical protein
MPDKDESSGLSSQINLTSLIALFTLLGGIFLVSHKLSSDRPVSSPERPINSGEDQTVEARLWEDPLKWKPDEAQTNGCSAFALLQTQILAHTTAGLRPRILAVMVQGGTYSEDIESRIRSRFAVVSALGESHYTPESPQHLGAVLIPWPAKGDLRSGWLTNSQSMFCLSEPPEKAGTNSTQTNPSNSSVWTNGLVCSTELPVSFEWYHRSEYFPLLNEKINTGYAPRESVLVLWLDEDRFGDHPEIRLGLLLHDLAQTNQDCSISGSMAGTTDAISSPGALSSARAEAAKPNSPATAPAPASAETNFLSASLVSNIALIGPRSSGTLRELLHQYGYEESASEATNRLREARYVLKCVDVFCATPSIADELLLSRWRLEYTQRLAWVSGPRGMVEYLLTRGPTASFRSFQNFSVTDAQLATQAVYELRLRGVDLAKPGNNLALIAEWDTSYGRALALTYAGCVAVEQKQASNLSEFIETYRSDFKVTTLPTNVFRFAYLRGIDGERTKTSKSEGSTSESSKSESSPGKVSSLEDIKHWNPDSNKASGEPEFDYLTRLGDRIREKQKLLDREDRGRITAIGIAGSDVYDTLLVLQALRPRFPNAIFFTTDLDVRFSDPSELDWSRNLLVFSGYGLQLHRDFQRRIAPFRDSSQTAQFAATLGALGDTNLSHGVVAAPRRFEIGRKGPYDLSMDNDANRPVIHPVPAAVRGYPPSHGLLTVMAILLGGVLTTLVWPPLCRLTWNARARERDALRLREEDVGGIMGARDLFVRLSQSSDPLAQGLWANVASQKTASGFSGAELLDSTKTPNCADMLEFLDLLHEQAAHAGPTQLPELMMGLPAPTSPPPTIFSAVGLLISVAFGRVADRLFRSPRPVVARAATPNPLWSTDSLLARISAFWMRREQRRLFWASLSLFLLALGLLIGRIQRETFADPTGKPFSLSGISLWPTEILRLVAVWLACLFVLRTYVAIKTGILTIVREYRLPFAPRNNGKGGWFLPYAANKAAVNAGHLWRDYQQLNHWGPRLRRISIPLGLYVLFAGLIFKLGNQPFVPFRGTASKGIDLTVLLSAVFAFLFLAFWIMDGVRLCCWFIDQLGEAFTIYPDATLTHFARKRALDEKCDLLPEWIDLHLIADLTSHVSRPVYYPFIVLLLLILSRNPFWDHWPWPALLIIVFGLNALLISGSVIMLQQAAAKAKRIGIARLAQKLEKVEAEAAGPQKHRAIVGDTLLTEIKDLKTGAFAPFWDNPLVQALLIPSGGTAFFEVLLYLFR